MNSRRRIAAAEVLESRHLLSGFSVSIDFRPATAPPPTGYLPDSGAIFGARSNGLDYGWNGPRPAQVVEHHARHLSDGPDERYDAFAVMHAHGRGSEWEIAVPDGTYQVQIVSGDPQASAGRYRIEADGVLVVDGHATRAQRWVEGTQQVIVTDGMLRITLGPKVQSGKLNFIDITEVVQTQMPSPSTPPAAPQPPTSSAPLQLNWQQVARSPVGRLEASAVTVGGKLYVFGGYGVDNPHWLASKETDVYDPATNNWTRLADMPEGLTHIGAATDGRFIYAAGGYVSNYTTGW